MTQEEINKAFDEEYIKYRDAFPKDYDLPTHFTSKHTLGMTLRDYFAAKSMQGFMANKSNPMHFQPEMDIVYPCFTNIP